jgi:hypothetical protein
MVVQPVREGVRGEQEVRPHQVIKVLGKPTLWATAPGRVIVINDQAIWSMRALHTMSDCYFLRRVQPRTGRRSEVVQVGLVDVDARWNHNAMAVVLAQGGIPVAYYCTRCLRRDIRDGYMPSDTLMNGR